jgi:hypothetical protein
MLALLFIGWLLFLHPVHVSVTDIVLDEQERELEITMRLFTDDLEFSVRNARNEPELDLLNPGKGRTTEELVREYVMQRFSVSLDGKKQHLKFLGIEQETDAIVCFIQAPDVRRWHVMEITNTVITETYDDQSNLVHVTLRGKVRSHRLTRHQPAGTFLFTDF